MVTKRDLLLLREKPRGTAIRNVPMAILAGHGGLKLALASCRRQHQNNPEYNLFWDGLLPDNMLFIISSAHKNFYAAKVGQDWLCHIVVSPEDVTFNGEVVFWVHPVKRLQ